MSYEQVNKILDLILPEYTRVCEMDNIARGDIDAPSEEGRLYKGTDAAGNVYLIVNPCTWKTNPETGALIRPKPKFMMSASKALELARNASPESFSKDFINDKYIKLTGIISSEIKYYHNPGKQPMLQFELLLETSTDSSPEKYRITCFKEVAEFGRDSLFKDIKIKVFGFPDPANERFIAKNISIISKPVKEKKQLELSETKDYFEKY